MTTLIVARDSEMAVATPAELARHEGDVAGLHRHVGAGADGDADVGLRERRGVVDAVADHRHPLALRLQRRDLGRLLARQHVGDARGRCRPRAAMASRRAPVVAGEHHDLEPELHAAAARPRPSWA